MAHFSKRDAYPSFEPTIPVAPSVIIDKSFHKSSYIFDVKSRKTSSFPVILPLNGTNLTSFSGIITFEFIPHKILLILCIFNNSAFIQRNGIMLKTTNWILQCFLTSSSKSQNKFPESLFLLGDLYFQKHIFSGKTFVATLVTHSLTNAPSLKGFSIFSNLFSINDFIISLC